VTIGKIEKFKTTAAHPAGGAAKKGTLVVHEWTAIMTTTNLHTGASTATETSGQASSTDACNHQVLEWAINNNPHAKVLIVSLKRNIAEHIQDKMDKWLRLSDQNMQSLSKNVAEIKAGKSKQISKRNKKLGTYSEAMYDAKKGIADAIDNKGYEWLSLCQENHSLGTVADCLHGGHRILHVTANSNDYSMDDPVGTFHRLLGSTGAAPTGAARQE
jgi:hypothetical protein